MTLEYKNQEHAVLLLLFLMPGPTLQLLTHTVCRSPLNFMAPHPLKLLPSESVSFMSCSFFKTFSPADAGTHSVRLLSDEMDTGGNALDNPPYDLYSLPL